MAIGSQWFATSLFALVAGLTEALAMVGGMIDEQCLTRIVHSSLGWRSSMGLCALLFLVLLVMALFFVQDKPQTHHSPKQRIEFKALVKIIQQPYFLLNGLFAASWSVPYFRLVFNLNAIDSAPNVSLIFLGLAVGMPLLGALEKYNLNRIKIMLSSSFILQPASSVIIEHYGQSNIASFQLALSPLPICFVAAMICALLINRQSMPKA